MPEKPKVALYWCASCGGCEESVVDLAEGILDVVAAVDIVLWPVAMDFKKKDVEAMADDSILVSLINGAVRTSEQEEMANHNNDILFQDHNLYHPSFSCRVHNLNNDVLTGRSGMYQEVFPFRS